MRNKEQNGARSEQYELETLHRLDEECVHQQGAGNYLKAFDCMERALVMRRHFFGVESEEVVQACRALSDMCNLLAMSFLQQDNYAVTFELLKKAEVLTQCHHPVERATTLNNFACYYRRLGKLHAAMSSLKQALALETKLKNIRSAADTQLNICAVLSQLGKHQEALNHAQEAIITLQKVLAADKDMIGGVTDASTGDIPSTRLDRISVMCIAYHNIGVEHEFLKEYAHSVSSYEKGVGFAERYLGPDHSITTTIRDSWLAVKRLLASKVSVRPRSVQKGIKNAANARLSSRPRIRPRRIPNSVTKREMHSDGSNGLQIYTPPTFSSEVIPRAPLCVLPPLEDQYLFSRGFSAPGDVESFALNSSPTDIFPNPQISFGGTLSEDETRSRINNTSQNVMISTNIEAETLTYKRKDSKDVVRKSLSTVCISQRNRNDEYLKPIAHTTTLASQADDLSGLTFDSIFGGFFSEEITTKKNDELNDASGRRSYVSPLLTEMNSCTISDVGVASLSQDIRVMNKELGLSSKFICSLEEPIEDANLVAQMMHSLDQIVDPVLESEMLKVTMNGTDGEEALDVYAADASVEKRDQLLEEEETDREDLLHAGDVAGVLNDEDSRNDTSDAILQQLEVDQVISTTYAESSGDLRSRASGPRDPGPVDVLENDLTIGNLDKAVFDSNHLQAFKGVNDANNFQSSNVYAFNDEVTPNPTSVISYDSIELPLIYNYPIYNSSLETGCAVNHSNSESLETNSEDAIKDETLHDTDTPTASLNVVPSAEMEDNDNAESNDNDIKSNLDEGPES
ncbi:putative tetratricopeptide-like helical domain superfamily [Plasmopara halstedii]